MRSRAGTCCIPTAKPRASHVEHASTDTQGPVIAATDYMRAFAEQIRALVPRRYVVLGTDGFGRSDTREKLRHFFEVDRRWVDGRGAEGAGRRRHDARDEGRRGASTKYGARSRRSPRRGPCDRLGRHGQPKRARDEHDRSQGPGHRRLQGRPGHRGPGQARRRGEGRGLARHARVRQGDDGRAVAVGRRR